MKEKTKNFMYGCSTLLVIAFLFFLMCYGGVTLFNNIFGL